jgi:hypothetical protein
MPDQTLACPYCDAHLPIPPGAAVGSRLSCSSCGETFTWKASQQPVAAPPHPDGGTPPSALPGSEQPAAPAASPIRLRVMLAVIGILLLLVPRALWMTGLLGGDGSALVVLDVAVLVVGVVVLITVVLIVGLDRANRGVGLCVLGGMAVMACAGVALALWTREARREHDRGLPPEQLPRRHKRNTGQVYPPETTETPADDEDGSRAPDRLAALGYLPNGTGVVVALDAVELARLRTEKVWLNEPLRIAGHEVPPKDLPAWTGLKADNLDHLLLAATLPSSGKGSRLPAVYLVVRSRKPYGLAEVLSALHSSPDQGKVQSKGTVYSVTLPRPVGKASLWSADARTLVFNLFGDDELRKVPFARQPGLDQLAHEVRAALVDRVKGPTPLWAVAHVADAAWLDGADKLPGLSVPKGLGEGLSKLETVAVWLQVPEAHAGREPGLLLHAALRARGTGAKELLAALGRPSLKDLGLDAKQDGDWLSVSWPVDRQTLEKALGK